MSILSGSSLTASQSTGLKWRTQPTPQTVEAGSSVSFTCLADNSEEIHVQVYGWEHDNLPLPDDDRFTVKNGGQTLEISQTKLEDRGDYRCVATRKGEVLGRSQNAALNIKGTCDRRDTNLSQNLGRAFGAQDLHYQTFGLAITFLNSFEKMTYAWLWKKIHRLLLRKIVGQYSSQ